jgi:hypothetical protein
MTEQFAFEQLFRKRGAGDVDERFYRAVAVVVDGLGREVFPGSRFTGQQHCGRGARRDARQHRLDLEHRGRDTNDRVEAVLRRTLDRSVRTSRRRRLVSSAFSTAIDTSCRLNGLSM